MSVPNIIRDVVEAARSWLRATNHYRRLVGTAAEDVTEKARGELIAAAKRLEATVLTFEKAYAQHAKKTKNEKGPKKQFPWGEVLRGALKGASALNSALEGGTSAKKVISIEGEVVMPHPPKK
jgi:hypothetical protein